MSEVLKPDQLLPGTVIAVRYPIYKHFAIVSDEHKQNDVTYKPNLISLSYRTGSVQEESWNTVVNDQPVEISTIRGCLATEDVLLRARSFIGSNIKYNLLNFNCEHFVRYAHGLPHESIQVSQTLKGAAIGAFSCALIPNLTLTRIAVITTASAVTSLKKSLNNI